MARKQKSTAIYKTPFSLAYWRDAAAELKDTRMLVIAALMIALRVALKGLGIPLAPNLKINIAFFINALGAMIFGPVVAIPAAIATACPSAMPTSKKRSGSSALNSCSPVPSPIAAVIAQIRSSLLASSVNS